MKSVLLCLLVAVTVISGAVVHHEINQVRSQTDSLAAQVHQPQVTLPPGSVTFTALSPALRQQLDDRTKTVPVTPTVSFTTPSVAPVNQTSVITLPAQTLTQNVNTWSGVQVFSTGVILGGSYITSLGGNGLKLVNGALQLTPNQVGTSNLANASLSLSKLSPGTCTSSQALQYTGSAWVCVGAGNSGIVSINGLTSLNQSIAADNAGTDAGLVSSGHTHTLSIPTSSNTVRGAVSPADWATFNAKQNALSFGSGVTDSSGAVTNNLLNGVSGGQSVVGGTGAADNLTLATTTNTSQGSVIFGTSSYNEAVNTLNLNKSSNGLALNVTSTASSTNGLAVFDWSPSASTSSSGSIVSINAGSHATIASLLNIKSNGTSVFKIGQTAVTFNQPATFNDSATFGRVSEPVTNVYSGGTYTIGADQAIIIDYSATTLNLPNVEAAVGRRYSILDQTGTITVQYGGNTIASVDSGGSVELTSNGTTWTIIDKYVDVNPYDNTGALSN